MIPVHLALFAGIAAVFFAAEDTVSDCPALVYGVGLAPAIGGLALSVVSLGFLLLTPDAEPLAAQPNLAAKQQLVEKLGMRLRRRGRYASAVVVGIVSSAFFLSLGFLLFLATSDVV